MKPIRGCIPVFGCENALFFSDFEAGEPLNSYVRLSFALGYWYEMAQEYQPALDKLVEIRDEAMWQSIEGFEIRESFRDLAAINRVFKDDVHTRDLFVKLDEKKRALAQSVYDLVQPALVRLKEYKLCGKYLDEIHSFRMMAKRFRTFREIAKTRELDSRVERFSENEFTNSATTLVALLVVNERNDQAAKIVEKAKKEWDDESFHAELEIALEGHVPVPWP